MPQMIGSNAVSTMYVGKNLVSSLTSGQGGGGPIIPANAWKMADGVTPWQKTAGTYWLRSA